MWKTESATYSRVRFLAGMVLLALIASAGVVRAQAARGGETGKDPAETAAEPTTAIPPRPRLFDRWIELQTATFLGRYRYVDTSAGAVSARQLQDNGAVKARIKFDRRGRLALAAGIATGNGFTSGWNNTGIGTGNAAKSWSLKQLFVAATPARGVELTYGGLALVRGQSTEITTYDNDGYLVGQRLSVRRPKNVFFDEVTGTVGYLGDVNTPGFTSRYRRLAEANYGQVLVSRKATAWLTASADYTRLAHVSTMRAAVAVKTPSARLIDLVRYEQYVRGGSSAAVGFAAYAQKAAHDRLTIGGGYADIDLHYGGLNADRFNKGRRVYMTGTLELTPELSASLFAARAVHNAGAIANKSRVDVIVTYNALATLKRTGLLR